MDPLGGLRKGSKHGSPVTKENQESAHAKKVITFNYSKMCK